jgi:hypothetical protein
LELINLLDLVDWFFKRQSQLKVRPNRTSLLLQDQRAAQPFGDPLAYVEPESLAAFDLGEVGQKYIFLIFRSDAGPLVRN